ncbi:MAG TPA: copper chaperone PCu(A)C, partial [Microthrixaceae bacterium]|nr:copper chaperone PCu(A)C [Microthrixaceae bacterium]
MHTDRIRRSLAAPMALALTAGVFLVGCGDDGKESSSSTTRPEASTSQPADDATISTSGVWARTSPAVASAGAVYLKITNDSDADDALVAASVDPSVAKKTELHETKAAGGGMSSTTAPEQGMGQGQSGDAHGSSTTAMGGGGMMTMAEVEKIPVAAGTTVALEPGGYHIMLMELAKPLVVGEKVKVTLTFEKAGDVVVEA